MKWVRKLTSAEKLENMRNSRRRARELEPTRDQLKDEPLKYCKRRGLSLKSTNRLLDLVCNGAFNIDYRDHRKLPKSERVPRSLEMPPTPPGFWDISD
jgi:hypothetical protein